MHAKIRVVFRNGGRTVWVRKPEGTVLRADDHVVGRGQGMPTEASRGLEDRVCARSEVSARDDARSVLARQQATSLRLDEEPVRMVAGAAKDTQLPGSTRLTGHGEPVDRVPRNAGEEPALLIRGPRRSLGECELPRIADRCVRAQLCVPVSQQSGGPVSRMLDRGGGWRREGGGTGS